MKILVIWGESLAKPGGGTVHCLGLVRGWRSLGHDVAVIAPAYNNMQPPQLGQDFSFVRLGPRSMLTFAMFQILALLRLPVWIYTHGCTTVYTRTCFLSGLMAVVCRLMGAVLIVEVDGATDKEIILRGESRWIARLTRMAEGVNNTLVHALVCVTEPLRDLNIARGARPGRCVAIPNGSPTDIMRPLNPLDCRNEMQFDTQEVIVGFVGTFAPWQGLDFLLDAVAVLKSREIGGFRVVLVGGGQMEDSIRQRIQREDLSSLVTLLPAMDNNRVGVFLSACDASILPRHDRRILPYGSPLKFFEAIALGLPVLVPRGSGLEPILADLGLPGVFDPSSPRHLADAIGELVPRLPDFRQGRQQIHAKVAEKYSWKTVARRIVAFAESLRENRNR